MSKITNKKLVKSFCRGVQMLHGAVFSKRAPLAAGGINLVDSPIEFSGYEV